MTYTMMYDDLSSINKSRFAVGGNTSTVTYTYNTNNQPDTLQFSNINQEYGYNGIGILNSKTLQMNDGTDLINYNYYYHDSERNEDGSTVYRTTKIWRELIGNVGYVYEYDVMGNITQIKEGTRKAGTDTTIENAVVKVQYEYDSQNQLVRENNKYLNKTIVYDYDNGGNILSRTEYAYTTAADLSSKTPR